MYTILEAPTRIPTCSCYDAGGKRHYLFGSLGAAKEWTAGRPFTILPLSVAGYDLRNLTQERLEQKYSGDSWKVIVPASAL